jgi:hypothetical protein
MLAGTRSLLNFRFAMQSPSGAAATKEIENREQIPNKTQR